MSSRLQQPESLIQSAQEVGFDTAPLESASIEDSHRDETNASDTSSITNKPSSPLQPWPHRYQLLIRKSDALAVVLLTTVSLVGMIFYFWHRSHIENGLIEIDRSGRMVTVGYQVDINRADWPEFDNLPGIGTGMAQSIVAFRETNGPFESHDQLTRIEGIGESTLEKLKPFLAPLDPARPATDDSADLLTGPPESTGASSHADHERSIR